MIETPMATKTITNEQLANAITYTQYRDLIDALLAEGKTTGTNHSEEMVEYTRMNMHRMRRMEKNTVLHDDVIQVLLSVQTKMIWVVLTEAWCGDAAQNLPALVKIADASPLIELKLLMRDENPELMDQYLTNGGRSIPKLIALDANTMEVLGTWGPRPVPAQELVLEAKAKDMPFKEMAEQLHGWYAKDKSNTLQVELRELISQWSELTAPAELNVARCS
ncbi:thioredoxin family protein [Pontibacter akesuensis]|uniref:Thiol-disulfide isomerase or thioredoxin n=2 Tax=Pontibacter akesuensis TaxID=388950 RepID=A0A1I7K2U2_9BACT|nr:thioredoxin family protein [Pontibacter akesuensis]GHA75506.1 thioredoxin [Pontibacter akesuensis]SFU91747.1 Thiol-disulfide isomerase or thioredoxin [Pontibacter akesuensis]